MAAFNFQFESMARQEFLAQAAAGAAGNDSSAVDDDDAVAGAFDFRQNVAGQNNREASAQVVDQFANPLNLVGVEADGRLIHNNDLRVAE